MNRGGRTLRSRTRRPALHSTIAGAFLLLMAACGGDRRSGAVSTDTSAAAKDTATAMANDTGKASPDTAAPARTDTVTTPRDTTRSTAAGTQRPSATQPPSPKPATAAKPAPKPKVAQAPKPDTTAKASAAPADTSAPAEQTTANAPLRDPYHPAPLDTVSQQVYNGWKQFNLNCARCHGEDVQGTTIAPHLIVSLKPDGPINTEELFVQTVCAGRPAKGMPAWCALGMDMPTIESIYSYVKGRSDAKIHPGRPAVKPGG
jgi:Cytochrome C oxidase, cbb3-type, subunit III